MSGMKPEGESGRTEEDLSGIRLHQRVAGLSPEGRRHLWAALGRREGADDGGGVQILAAAVVPEPGVEIGEAERAQLAAYLAERLPPWTAPARLAVISSIPRTPNGKIDRKAVAAAVARAFDDTEEPLGRGAVETRLSGGNDAVETGRTRVEAAIARLMADVLQRPSVGLRENFFELGGHSLLVAELTRRIRDTLGVELPLRALFAAPAPVSLAALVEERESGVMWPSLVGIRTAGRGPILFLVHGLGGGVFEYYRLGEHFPREYRLYGIQAPMEPWSDLEAMAEAYLNEVRKVQAQGPYYLGGYCLGGSVAFEMSRRLSASGDTAALLALIESSLPAGVLHSPASLAPRVLQMTRRMAKGGSTGLVDSVRRQARRLGRQVKRTLYGAAESWRDEVEDVVDMEAYPEAYRGAATAHFRALRDYRPQPCPERAWLFKSDDDKLAYLGSSLGWDRFLLGGVRVERVPGDHHGTFQPGAIEVLAEGLGRAMCEAAFRAGDAS